MDVNADELARIMSSGTAINTDPRSHPPPGRAQTPVGSPICPRRLGALRLAAQATSPRHLSAGVFSVCPSWRLSGSASQRTAVETEFVSSGSTRQPGICAATRRVCHRIAFRRYSAPAPDTAESGGLLMPAAAGRSQPVLDPGHGTQPRNRSQLRASTTAASQQCINEPFRFVVRTQLRRSGCIAARADMLDSRCSRLHAAHGPARNVSTLPGPAANRLCSSSAGRHTDTAGSAQSRPPSSRSSHDQSAAVQIVRRRIEPPLGLRSSGTPAPHPTSWCLHGVTTRHFASVRKSCS